MRSVESLQEKQTEFIEKMKLSKPKLFFDLINQNRKLYNTLCRSCQIKTVTMKGKIKPKDYCDKCQNRAEPRLNKIKEIIEKAGGKVGE